MNQLPVIDAHGRVHTSLRISVTDRCNIRCFYCMPEFVKFLPQRDVLTFEEIHRVVSIVAGMGVNKIRLTGGEPLVRAELWSLIEMLVAIKGIEEVALTTNGILLAEQASQLRSAGLSRINVSLDSVNANVFERITRRKGLEKVLSGIAAATDAGFTSLRLNAVSIKGLTEAEIVPLATFARNQKLELRFIEFMPLDADNEWELGQVLTGMEVVKVLESEFGELKPLDPTSSNQPAVDFGYADGNGTVGFINSVSQPFCQSCNRMRMTAEGKFRNCLFSTVEWDLRDPLRSGADDGTIADRIRECILAKKQGHGMDADDFQRPEKAMYQIGG